MAEDLVTYARNTTAAASEPTLSNFTAQYSTGSASNTFPLTPISPSSSHLYAASSPGYFQTTSYQPQYFPPPPCPGSTPSTTRDTITASALVTTQRIISYHESMSGTSWQCSVCAELYTTTNSLFTAISSSAAAVVSIKHSSLHFANQLQCDSKLYQFPSTTFFLLVHCIILSVLVNIAIISAPYPSTTFVISHAEWFLAAGST